MCLLLKADGETALMVPWCFIFNATLKNATQIVYMYPGLHFYPCQNRDNKRSQGTVSIILEEHRPGWKERCQCAKAHFDERLRMCEQIPGTYTGIEEALTPGTAFIKDFTALITIIPNGRGSDI